MATYPITEKTEITRLAKRGAYDRETIYQILDEALFCTVSFVKDQHPFAIPTGFCRVDNTLYLHGSVGSTYMRLLAEGVPACISVFLADGLVLARSAFHHSVNYRSVVLFSKGRKVTDESELYRSLEVFTNKMCPGRWADVRQPDAGEWKATLVLAFEIEEASAKIRVGPPKDDEADYQLPVWAGVVPLVTSRGVPEQDPALKPGVALPDYLR
jgi:nitroimidazol reductase NimA-like FMN-containing flavoprotein (pyridoxamine 5'-phosphate oxidase superfamily)